MGSYVSLPIFAASIRERYRLEEPRCLSCGSINVPARMVCLECGAGEFQWERLSGRGRVFTYTVIARGGAPTEFDEQQTMTGPIVVAIIELEEGAKVVAQLTDCSPEQVSIGSGVRAVFRRLYDQEGVVRYGYKFVLECTGESLHGSGAQ
jgi:uncharacterized OB-fold protein